jgi:hypothetical protein
MPAIPHNSDDLFEVIMDLLSCKSDILAGGRALQREAARQGGDDMPDVVDATGRVAAAIRALETAHAAALHDRIVQAVVDDGLAEYSTTGLGHYIRGGWLICTRQNRYLMVGRRSVGAVRVDQDGVIISRIGETPPRRYCTPGFCFEVPGMAIGQAIPSPLDISAAKSGQKMMPWAG